MALTDCTHSEQLNSLRKIMNILLYIQTKMHVKHNNGCFAPQAELESILVLCFLTYLSSMHLHMYTHILVACIWAQTHKPKKYACAHAHTDSHSHAHIWAHFHIQKRTYCTQPAVFDYLLKCFMLAMYM